jgi:cell division protein FtsB
MAEQTIEELKKENEALVSRVNELEQENKDLWERIQRPARQKLGLPDNPPPGYTTEQGDPDPDSTS